MPNEDFIRYSHLSFPDRPSIRNSDCNKLTELERYKIRNQNTPYGMIDKERICQNSAVVDGVLVLRENNYSLELTRRRVGTALWKVCTYDYGWRQGNTLNACSSGGTTQTLPTALYDEPLASDATMVNKLLDKWKQSDFSLGVTLGESASTLRGVANAAGALANAARNLRRGNLSAALRGLSRVPGSGKRAARQALDAGDLASAWMACRYGWVPLMGDIYGLNDLQYEYNKLPKIVVSKWTPGVPYHPYSPAYADLYRYRIERAQRWQAFLDTEKLTASLPTRLGLTDPASIAWELVPFSFVVDWFLPVGHFLKSLEAARVLPVAKITKTIFYRERIRMRPATENREFRGIEGDYVSTRVSLSRLVNQALPTGFSLLSSYPGRNRVHADTASKRAVDGVILAGNAIAALSRR